MLIFIVVGVVAALVLVLLLMSGNADSARITRVGPQGRRRRAISLTIQAPIVSGSPRTGSM